MKQSVRPNKLQKGDKIAIISPAGAVEEIALQSTLDLIKQKGYIPVLGKTTLGKFSNGYNYSGTEKARLEDINWAFSDSEISAIWATRGGYGCQHLLQELDAKSINKNPKFYIGYSDNTAIQAYLLKNKIASIHGQTLKTSSFGVTKKSYDSIFEILEGKSPKYALKQHKLNKKGSAEGVLVGGNLALIYALLASPFSFKFKNKILFIEDIGENYYALDRMLMALELSGVFNKIKGLIVGGMTNMGNEKENPNYEKSFDNFAYQLIFNRLQKYDFPILFGFPNGHIHNNQALIIGANVHVEVADKVELNYL